MRWQGTADAVCALAACSLLALPLRCTRERTELPAPVSLCWAASSSCWSPPCLEAVQLQGQGLKSPHLVTLPLRCGHLEEVSVPSPRGPLGPSLSCPPWSPPWLHILSYRLSPNSLPPSSTRISWDQPPSKGLSLEFSFQDLL